MTKEDLMQIAELMDAKLDAKLAPINMRLDNIDSRLDKIESRLDKVESRLDKVESRLDSLETAVEEIREDTTITRVAVNSLIEWAEHVAVITAVPYPIRKAE